MVKAVFEELGLKVAEIGCNNYVKRGHMQSKSLKDSTIGALRRALLIVLALALLVGFCPMPAHAASGPTKADVLAVLKKYDKDGYYIVKTMDKRGDDVMAYWSGSNLFNDFDTTVHEECHGYTHAWGSDNIYIGGKKSINVAYANVFRSKKIAKSVPKKLRSDRFWLYVGKAEPNLASNMLGPYGMLNEFAAYCWGFNNTVKLYSFAKTFKCTDAVWLDYVSASDVAKAYVEFRYFIEHYLYYAKKHNMKVYKSVVRNKQFVRAFRIVDKKFASLVKTFDWRLSKIAKLLRKAGYNVEYSGDYYRVGKGWSNRGRGLGVNEYNRFAAELNKSKYRKIEKKLGLKHVTKRVISVGSTASVRSKSSNSLVAATL